MLTPTQHHREGMWRARGAPPCCLNKPQTTKTLTRASQSISPTIFSEMCKRSAHSTPRRDARVLTAREGLLPSTGLQQTQRAQFATPPTRAPHSFGLLAREKTVVRVERATKQKVVQLLDEISNVRPRLPKVQRDPLRCTRTMLVQEKDTASQSSQL